MTGETLITVLEISAHLHSPWVSVDHWQAEHIFLPSSCPTSCEMTREYISNSVEKQERMPLGNLKYLREFLK